MPFSKHRRKPGGKSVRHPGRSKEFDREFARYRRFVAGYAGPFQTKHGHDGGPHGSSYLLDILVGLAFDMTSGALRPASKAEVLIKFTEEIDIEAHTWTEADAEAALAFLQAEGMVEVEGDEIRVPARFWLEPAGPA